jgi:threonine dehydrogenase-like Zn-dependent dehydrogenase
VWAYNEQEFAAILCHIAAGRLDVRPLMTGCIGFAEVGQTFKDLANSETHAKTLVDPLR